MKIELMAHLKRWVKTFSNVSLKNVLVVFLYHDVTDSPSEFSQAFNLNVRPDVFERQVKFIKKNFNIISPDDLLNGNIPSRAALISFDDGFRSYFQRAIPILKKYDVPSIIFLNMEPVKGGIFWSGFITYICRKNESFKEYLKKMVPKGTNKNLLPFFCSREIINKYNKNLIVSYSEKVARFTGAFATEEDLNKVSLNQNVFFGNHLFNHENPMSMSDEELLMSFRINQEELQKYPNYLNFFSFPFGQPGIFFSKHHIKLLSHNGVKKLFSSAGGLNHDLQAACLDRVPLNSTHDSSVKIWRHIFYRSFIKKVKSVLKLC